MIQREISALENVPNLWKAYPSESDDVSGFIDVGTGFGGYQDWTYERFDGKISLRNGYKDDEELTVGTYGLCIKCGEETDRGLYCEECGKYPSCDECGHHCHENELTWVRDSNGDEIQVCESCLDENYSYCDRCEEYYPQDNVTAADGMAYCDECLEENCSQCEDCGDWHYFENLYKVINENGDEVYVCDSCRENSYTECECCGEYVHDSTITRANDKFEIWHAVCEECLEENYAQCEGCGDWYEHEALKDGHCNKCFEETDESEVETA